MSRKASEKDLLAGAHPGPDTGRPHARLDSARGLALRALGDLRGGRLTARETIDAIMAKHSIREQELAFATELVMGVVRHRLTLARLLGALACRGWKNVNERLRHILMIAAYQLIWLDTVPAFAAVNEAVEQAKAEGGAKAGRFVNAVLRQFLRDIEQRRIPTAVADPRRSVLVDSQWSCQFKRDVFPDPEKARREYLADTTSHPLWLVSRWVDAYGFERTQRICRANMERPPVVLRPNRLRIDAAGLAAKLQDEGIAAAVTHDGLAVTLQRAAGLTATRAFREGLMQPQDLTSIETIRAACGHQLRPGQTVLDLCAGLGTKATQMAEIMENRGLILATDKDPVKLDALHANCQRLGVTIVRTLPVTELASTFAEVGPPDWIVVDAPCSNTGVLARRPEARYRINKRTLESLAAIQLGLLDRAAALAGPNTRLLYSTCSIDPQENEGVATAFAHSHPGWELLNSRLTLPEPPTEGRDWRDGGYWATWMQRP